MGNIYFVGDIHGCIATFRKLVTEKIGIRKADTIYCVGDYIDRGRDSKGVVDFILELRKQNYLIHTLRGNHEQMLLDSAKDDKMLKFWMLNGGQSTLESFGIESANQLDHVYRDFFRETKFYIKKDDFIVVHAGMDFQAVDPFGENNAMLWIRDFSADKSFLGGNILIHGHTPRERELILSQQINVVLNVDGGCVYKDVPGLGNLFAYNFYEQEFIEVPNID